MSKKENRKLEKKDKEQCASKRVFLYNSPGHFDENNNCFLNALDEAIDKENIFNIGVIAPYGSGKSSFIKTYFDNRPKKKRKACSISLATFENIEPNETTISKVEKSILEQILFKRKHSWLSKTKLDRIHGRFWWTLLFSLLLVSTISLILLSIMEYTKTLPFSDGSYFYYYFAFAVFSGLLTSFLGFYGLKISKVAFKNIEVEFNHNSGISVLNLFIDEIINYCDESDIRYFIFEDIDRFGCVSLFLKLREINKLINENESITNKVTFIYCVRDDVFDKTEDRAKFFDFIISLIPIFNPNKTREFIIKAIAENNDEELLISESVIMDVCIYIKEIRVLNDIVNDYIFYHDGLNIHKSDNDKLFVMMVYKNLFPLDFAKLQSNSGTLYDVFNSCKEKAIANANTSISEEINKYEKKISDSLYDDAKLEFNKLKQRISGILIEHGTLSTSLQSLGGKSINNKTAQSYDSDLSHIYIDFNYNGGYYGGGTNYKYMSIDSLKQYLDNKTPSELENDIFGKNKAEYQRKLDSLYYKRNHHRRMSVVELISNGFFNENDLASLKLNKFLYFAIVNGYIDESFFKFSGRQDTELDNEYIDKVLTNSSVDPEENIQNPTLVISLLDVNKFATKSILNYSIANVLLCNQKDYRDKKTTFIMYLSTNPTETTQFVVGYLLKGQYKKELLNELKDSNYQRLIDDVAKLYGMQSRETIEFLKTIISISKDDNSIIEYFNNDNIVANIIENNVHPIEEFFVLFESELSFIDFLKSIKISKLKHIDDISAITNTAILKIFNEIVENTMFEINEYNVPLIANFYFKTNPANATCFLRSTNSLLNNYFRDNLESLIQSLSYYDVKYTDEREIVKEIITNQELSVDSKNNYLVHLDGRVDYIDNLPVEVYGTLLTNNLLVANFSSISKLLKNKSIETKLVANYVCNNISSFGDSISKNDFINLVNHEELSVETVELLCGYLNEKIGIGDIVDDSKRSVVIKKGMTVLDSSSLKLCKGMNKSISSCLNADSGLIDQLSGIMTNGKDYLELTERNDLNTDVKSLILSKYYNNFCSQLNDESLNMIKSIVLLNRNTKYDYRLLASLLRLSNSEEDTNGLIEICNHTLSDKEIIYVVKENDVNLFNILNSDQDRIAINLSYVDNIYFVLLEKKNIIKSFNKRINKCNVNVTIFKSLLSNG